MNNPYIFKNVSKLFITILFFPDNHLIFLPHNHFFLSRRLQLLFCCLFFAGTLPAQTPDSLIIPVTDSAAVRDTMLPQDSIIRLSRNDSLSKRPVTTDSGWILSPEPPVSGWSLARQILQHHPYFGFGSHLQSLAGDAVKHQAKGKEWIFYLLIFLLMVFGALRRIFPKYFSDLFRLFFRTTIKQRQIKEQLVQTPLPSLLLNGFFVISTGLYIAFLLQYFHLDPFENFWLLLLYSIAGLSAVYFIKFAGLKISGWLFGMEETAEAYIFIVFVVNKMLGILILPFLLLIAFAQGNLFTAGLALSWCLVGGLLLYRFILTYAAIRNQVKLNPFHFFLYLCAFELAPLLLIYKGLLIFLGINA